MRIADIVEEVATIILVIPLVIVIGFARSAIWILGKMRLIHN